MKGSGNPCLAHMRHKKGSKLKKKQKTVHEEVHEIWRWWRNRGRQGQRCAVFDEMNMKECYVFLLSLRNETKNIDMKWGKKISVCQGVVRSMKQPKIMNKRKQSKTTQHNTEQNRTEPCFLLCVLLRKGFKKHGIFKSVVPYVFLHFHFQERCKNFASSR